uniref:Uncharacterized protein n=1 Tax=Knipowitschia caucasica TaxID=637954 RepID=A0AAV2M137_KNICA
MMMDTCKFASKINYTFYRTDETALFDGTFIAKDREVEVFVDHVRSQMPSTCERALTEQSNLEDLKKEHNLADNTVEQWVFEVRQWAETGLRLKRQVFDQVMLVSRLQEEKDILLHEMMRHCTFLRQKVGQLNTRIVKNTEDFSNQVCPEELTKEGYQGLHCCLLYQQHHLKQHLQEVTGTYMRVATKTFVWSQDEMQDESDAEDSDSIMSGNDSDTQ